MSDPQTLQRLEYSQATRTSLWRRSKGLVLLACLAVLCIVSAGWPVEVAWSSGRHYAVGLDGCFLYFREVRIGLLQWSEDNVSLGPETQFGNTRPVVRRPPVGRALGFLPCYWYSSFRTGSGWSRVTSGGVSIAYPTLGYAVWLLLKHRRSIARDRT